jgi:hypothetical protein
MSLIHQASALIAKIQAWILLLQKIPVMQVVYPLVTYGPMLARDQEGVANLNFIYNTNDVDVVQMPRMRRAPFYELVKTFRDSGLLQDSMSKLICFFILLAITRGLELCTTHSGDPYRLYPAISTKSFTQLGSSCKT